MTWFRRLTAAASLLVTACGDTTAAGAPDGAVEDATLATTPDAVTPATDLPSQDGATHVGTPDVPTPPDVPAGLDVPAAPDGPAPSDGSTARDVPPAPPPCRTRVTYGDGWMRPPGHPDAFDDVDGLVTWDGVCTDDGPNSHATLSNGWQPYFVGTGRCVVALDAAHCPAVSPACTTRYTYGSTWRAPAGHTARYDDVPAFASWDGVCRRDGSNGYAILSNGWRPYFTGPACAVSVRQTQCGPQYVNPVMGASCPDPGVLRVGGTYYMVCTSGNASDAFPIHTSRDLVHWTDAGAVFPAGHRPSWAASDFWAPEIHAVGTGYVAYFTARRAGGQLAVGAASAPSPTGPFTDLGHPLVYDAAMGLIDPTEFQAADGSLYLYWKEDGNAIGRPTPIHGQRLAADGLSVMGPAPVLITNDLPWEGAVVEGPWVTAHDGMVYLFYSANAYDTGRYAVGVARAAAPLGPFTKHGGAILVSSVEFAGPGHGSVVDGPLGTPQWVYHAWRAGLAGAPGEGRQPLVDAITWTGGWPLLPGAPSSDARPLP